MKRFPNQARFTAFVDGKPVGISMAVVDSLGEDGAMFADVSVLAEFRCRGIGTALQAAVAEWAKARGGTYFQISVRESQVSAMEYWTKRGYTEVEREVSVSLDVKRSVVLAGESVPGLQITTLRESPELLPAVYEVGSKTWGDVPSHVPEKIISFEKWKEGVLTSPDAGPERFFIARCHGEVVGYAELVITPAAPDIAWNGFTGVSRKWRRKGVAFALKTRQIEWAKANEIREIRTFNEIRNEPMRALNEKLGFTYRDAVLLLKGDIA
jgi:GNAT superfamily N-acetyltransferase